MTEDKPRKKKKQDTTVPVASSKPMETEDLQFINETLARSFDRYHQTVEREMRDYNDDADALQTTVREFLDDFIIIGHTIDERRIVVRYAPTPKGYDSLKELSREYLMRMFMGGPMADD